MTERNDRMVWIDCEMTGLSLEHDALVEVAALVTDADLNVLGEGIDVVIRPPDEALEQMPDVVRDMHTTSGLLASLPTGLTLSQAEKLVLDYVREHVPAPRKAPLAGNTVYVDRGFLARDMPALDEHLHYRLVDVSSIKELARRWFPKIYFNAPAKHGGPPGPRRHPREHPGAQVLPRGPLRRAARAALPSRSRRRRPASCWHRPPRRSTERPVPGLYDSHRRGTAAVLVVGVAQLVEHLVVVQVAAGSSPVTHPTMLVRRPA